MLYELDRARFAVARPLFCGLEAAQPMCIAVLEGVYPGRLFLDDPSAPRAAFLSTFIGSEDEGVWGFLAGDPDHAEFNRALNAALTKCQIMSPRTPAILLTCDPDDWGGHVGAVVKPATPERAPRRRYVCRALSFDWQALVPHGFAVRPMDSELLRRPDLDLPEEVRQTIEKWQSATHPAFRDFGFVAVDETGPRAVVACWATVDFVACGAGDIGFFTQEPYRRRGLATITAAAALEHGLSSGLAWINWTCMDGNPGSVRTAEKLGLDRAQDYTMVWAQLSAS